ncbi:Ada metal-binding domain-containing protein [Stutzerimonas sp. NM35]
MRPAGRPFRHATAPPTASSSARLPRRENVEFFDNAEAAEAAGYRTSRRVQGDQSSAAAGRANLVLLACRLHRNAIPRPESAAGCTRHRLPGTCLAGIA